MLTTGDKEEVLEHSGCKLYTSLIGQCRKLWAVMSRSGFMMDSKRFTKTALDVHGKLNIRIQQAMDDNNTWLGVIDDSRGTSDDNLGALYYVVAVIFIYGMSIVMMIASHIRKNKQDNQLRTYLKEMAKLRKDDRRDKVLSKMTDIAKFRQQQESKQKLQERLKDTPVDSDAESEVSHLLTKKDTSDDNTDSVFLSPDYCHTPESISPSLSESRCNYTSTRVRSPSFHDYRRWKRNSSRSVSVQDYKSVRIQQRPSLSLYDNRTVFSYADNRSQYHSETRLSPLCGRERSSTVHEAHPFRWYKPKLMTGSAAKFHKISDTKKSKNAIELKLNLPANFHIVDEDAYL